MIFVPQDMFNRFSREKCKEIRDLSRVVRRIRNKRKTHTPLPNLPTIPQIQPRSNNIRNKKQKAAASVITRQSLLDTIEELGNINNVSETRTEEEILVVTLCHSQCQVAFNIASK